MLPLVSPTGEELEHHFSTQLRAYLGTYAVFPDGDGHGGASESGSAEDFVREVRSYALVQRLSDSGYVMEDKQQMHDVLKNVTENGEGAQPTEEQMNKIVSLLDRLVINIELFESESNRQFLGRSGGTWTGDAERHGQRQGSS